MSSLTHGSFMEDMSSDLRSVVLLGPKPRPPIGGMYHPNARQRQAAEAGARRIRMQRLLQIHESRKAVLHMERGLQASRASLLAMEQEAGQDGVETLAMFKSPAVPAMLRRKRRLRDALADVEAGAAATCGCQGQEDDAVAAERQRMELENGVNAKRHHLGVHDDVAFKRHRTEVLGGVKRQHSEVHDDVAFKRHHSEVHDDVAFKRHHSEVHDDVAFKRHHSDVHDDVAFKRHHSEVHDDLKRHRSEVHDDVAAKRHRAEAQDNVTMRRRRLEQEEDGDDARHVRRRLDDGVGVMLRHKRLAALQEEELTRQRAGLFHDEARRIKSHAAAQEAAMSRLHRAELRQDDALRRRQAVQEQEGRWQRSDLVQDDALYRQQRAEVAQDDVQRHHRRGNVEEALHRRRQHNEQMAQHRMRAHETVETSHRYQRVVRELREVQEERAEAAELKIQVTASSASPPVAKKLVLVDDEDVSPMVTAWSSKPGYEPTTPTDCIPSPLFMRGPRGVPGSSPDPLCRSPSAMCRSPCAR